MAAISIRGSGPRHISDLAAETWSLVGIAAALTILRISLRLSIKSSSRFRLQLDDFFATLALLFFVAQGAINQVGGQLFHNHAPPDFGHIGEALEAAPPGSLVYQAWVKGQKLHFVTWGMYFGCLWCLKLALLVLYDRLTASVLGPFRLAIRLCGIVTAASLAANILTLFLQCRPFGRYFDPHPYPSSNCQVGYAPAVLWLSYATNVITDLWLIAIPLPLLWGVRLTLARKIGFTALFSGGLLVIASATVRCVLIASLREQVGSTAPAWQLREGFVAIVTSNIPVTFTLSRMLGRQNQTRRSNTKESGSGPSFQLKSVGSSSSRRGQRHLTQSVSSNIHPYITRNPPRH